MWEIKYQNKLHKVKCSAAIDNEEDAAVSWLSFHWKSLEEKPTQIEISSRLLPNGEWKYFSIQVRLRPVFCPTKIDPSKK